MTPFGFTPPHDPDDPENSQNPGGEDFNAMMKSIQEQMREQFEKLGIPMENLDGLDFLSPEKLAEFTSGLSGFPGFNPSQFNSNGATTNSDALPIATVKETAKKFVTAHGFAPLSVRDQSVVDGAFEIGEIWLNEATAFPSSFSTQLPSSISRADWVDLTIEGWHREITPLAEGLLLALADLLAEAQGAQNEEGSENPIPLEALGGLLRTFIASMIATQLGQSVGTLAASVTGAHDVGLPILTPARPVLIPENISAWALDLEIPQSEIYLFHALRESAVARLFGHNPWLVSYIQSTITEYGRGIHIDLDAIQRQAEEVMNGMDPANFDPANFDPANFDPSKGFSDQLNLSMEFNNGIFSPEETSQQKLALEKLETVLALIDGWVDDVVTTAVGDRMPNMQALRETQRRRRAATNPAAQLFATLLGLEVSPRLTREASAFWKTIRELTDASSRDALWAGLLPTAADLKDPSAFIASSAIPDDLSGLT
jgi:putative hydrolase